MASDGLSRGRFQHGHQTHQDRRQTRTGREEERSFQAPEDIEAEITGKAGQQEIASPTQEPMHAAGISVH